MQKCYKMHCGVRLHGRNACYVIFWNIAPKHWIYMDRGYCNSFYFYLWLYNYLEYVIECVFAVEGHIHNFQLKLLSIALYYFISTLYMYSNWNYQNLPGKSCRIEKNPIMISPALWCQITWSKCMLCNILEYCSQTLDIHGQRVLQLILFLFMTFLRCETYN
jgi:hypothetical protein